MEVGGQDGATLDATPPLGLGDDVKDAVRQVTLQTVRTLTLWMGPLFLLFIPFDYVFSGPPGPLLAGLDAVVGLLYLSVHAVSRWGAIGPKYAQAAAGLVALAALPYILANLWLTQLPVYSSGLALWQMAIGLLLLSWPWMLALLVVSNVAWTYLALRLDTLHPSPDWAQYTFVLASASVMGIVAHAVRLRSTRHLEILRLQERARRMELERAQAAAREVEAVRRVNELKTQFINTAAHELATPMTPVLLQMYTLRRQLEPGMTEEQRHSWEVLERNMDRLKALLRDVLDSARLQTEHLAIRFSPLDLGDVAAAVVQEYGEAARSSGVRLVLHSPDPVPVQGDPQRLHQVLANLVSNAVKFTPREGKVTVRVQIAKTGAYVEVADTGLGLSPRDIPRLFQPFAQVHDPRHVVVPGTGLGLYICKGILERHGGEIGAKSDGPGKGSQFWFTLP